MKIGNLKKWHWAILVFVGLGILGSLLPEQKSSSKPVIENASESSLVGEEIEVPTTTVAPTTTAAAVTLLPGPSGSLVMVVRNALGVTQQFIQATITSSPDSGSYSPTTSDVNGKIEFTAGTLPAGDYSITLADTNTPVRFQSQSFLVHINSNQTTSLLIDLAAINTVYIPIEVVPATDFGPATPYPAHVSVSLYKTGTGATCSTVAYALVSSATSATSGSQEIATFTNIPSGTYYVGIGGCDTGTVSNFKRLVITSYPVVIDAAVPSQWITPIRLAKTTRTVTASASIGGTQSAITSMSLSGGFLSSDSAGVATVSDGLTTYVFSSVPPGVYTLTMVQSPYPNRIERITVGDENLVTSTYAMDATQRTITVTVNGPSSGGALATLSNGLSCTTVSGVTCTIANVPDGTYTLTGSATGYVTTTSSSFTTSSSTTTAAVTLAANAATSRIITVTVNGPSSGGALATLSNGLSCTTVSGVTCTIANVPDGAYTLTGSATGYVTTTSSSFTTSSSTTTAAVTLAANARSIAFTTTGIRLESESIIVSVSGGYTCTIATNLTTSGSCQVTVPAGTYTASATTATRQGSNTVTVSDAATSVSITLS
jgi:hypothetical protein